MKNKIDFIRQIKRKTTEVNLNVYDILAGENDICEITEWCNSEGIDVLIYKPRTIDHELNFQLSYEELNCINDCVKLIKKMG